MRLLLYIISVSDEITAYEIKRELYESGIAKKVTIFKGIKSILLNDTRYKIDNGTILIVRLKKNNLKKIKKLVKDIEVERVTDMGYSDDEINDEIFDFEGEIID